MLISIIYDQLFMFCEGSALLAVHWNIDCQFKILIQSAIRDFTSHPLNTRTTLKCNNKRQQSVQFIVSIKTGVINQHSFQSRSSIDSIAGIFNPRRRLRIATDFLEERPRSPWKWFLLFGKSRGRWNVFDRMWRHLLHLLGSLQGKHPRSTGVLFRFERHESLPTQRPQKTRLHHLQTTVRLRVAGELTKVCLSLPWFKHSIYKHSIYKQYNL